MNWINIFGFVLFFSCIYARMCVCARAVLLPWQCTHNKIEIHSGTTKRKGKHSKRTSSNNKKKKQLVATNSMIQVHIFVWSIDDGQKFFFVSLPKEKKEEEEMTKESCILLTCVIFFPSSYIYMPYGCLFAHSTWNHAAKLTFNSYYYRHGFRSICPPHSPSPPSLSPLSIVLHKRPIRIAFLLLLCSALLYIITMNKLNTLCIHVSIIFCVLYIFAKKFSLCKRNCTSECKTTATHQ